MFLAELEIKLAYWCSGNKEDRKWQRKHWTTGDPQLFDYVAVQNGFHYDPFNTDEDEVVRKRNKRWDQLDQLDAALLRLKPVLRETVNWYYKEGKTYQWIADKHGVAVSTSYKRLNRALEKLRVIVAEEDNHV